MKKIISSILLMTMMIMMPYSVMAQTTDVGVKITGSVSIEVVTTISADITLDLSTGEITPTYMEIVNKSTVPVEAKITNISTSSSGAPNTFVGASDKDWDSLSKEDTAKYVNFNITGSGQNVSAKDILPSGTVELGALNSYIEDDCSESICTTGIGTNAKIYEINANFGRNWSEGDKNFTYQITTVYSQANEYVDPTLAYTYPESEITFSELKLYSVRDTVDIESTDPTKTYISFKYAATHSNEGAIDSVINKMAVVVNGETAVYAGENSMGGPTSSEGENHYSIAKLKNGVNYLNIKLTFEGYEYTSIVKVIVK